MVFKNLRFFSNNISPVSHNKIKIVPGLVKSTSLTSKAVRFVYFSVINDFQTEERPRKNGVNKLKERCQDIVMPHRLVRAGCLQVN